MAYVVVALAAHGAFDFVHPHWVEHHGVPGFWPSFCSAYDFTAAALLALLIRRSNAVTTTAARGLAGSGVRSSAGEPR